MWSPQQGFGSLASQQPGPQPQPCSPAPIFTPCLIQSPADCKVSAYLPDREFLASSCASLLPSPAGYPPGYPCKPLCSSTPAPTSPSGSSELILFAWSVNLNSFKYASAGLGGRTLMLQNRGLASKETGGTGAGLQECHLKAQKQSIVRRGYWSWGGGGGDSNELHRREAETALKRSSQCQVQKELHEQVAGVQKVGPSLRESGGLFHGIKVQLTRPSGPALSLLSVKKSIGGLSEIIQWLSAEDNPGK